MDKFFFHILTKLVGIYKLSLGKSENNSGFRGGRISEKVKKKHLSAWQVGFSFYSPSLNITGVWRVGECLSTPLPFPEG
jgi:hypothetical protein